VTSSLCHLLCLDVSVSPLTYLPRSLPLSFFLTHSPSVFPSRFPHYFLSPVPATPSHAFTTTVVLLRPSRHWVLKPWMHCRKGEGGVRRTRRDPLGQRQKHVPKKFPGLARATVAPLSPPCESADGEEKDGGANDAPQVARVERSWSCSVVFT
jgi:hypothetical protein